MNLKSKQAVSLSALVTPQGTPIHCCAVICSSLPLLLFSSHTNWLPNVSGNCMVVFTRNSPLLDAYISSAVDFGNLVRNAIALATSKSLLRMKFLIFIVEVLKAI